MAVIAEELGIFGVGFVIIMFGVYRAEGYFYWIEM